MPTGNTNGGIHASEACGPFDSEDRRQPARNLRTMLATVVRDNGVAGGVGNQMQITQSTPQTLSVRVRDGGALLGDPADELYWYDNPSDFTFDDFAAPHASQARIDLLGILLDTSDPSDLYGGVQVITGTPAGSPQRPSHNHGDNFVELAQIRIPGGASRIVSGNITDTRSYIERTTYQQLRDSLIFTGIARRSLDPARNQITVNVPATNVPDPPTIPTYHYRVIAQINTYFELSASASTSRSLAITANRVLHITIAANNNTIVGFGAIDDTKTSVTIGGVTVTRSSASSVSFSNANRGAGAADQRRVHYTLIGI